MKIQTNFGSHLTTDAANRKKRHLQDCITIATAGKTAFRAYRFLGIRARAPVFGRQL